MFSSASVLKRKSGFVLKWTEEMEREESTHESRKAARETYYIQIAYDYMGSAIRDNTREQKIQFGKDIEKYGVDESGQIDYPKQG